MWRRLFRSEPVIVALAGADAVVLALLVASNALGLTSLDGSALAAISAAVVAISGFVAAVVRAAVVPVPTHQAAVDEALHTPVPADVIAWGGDV